MAMPRACDGARVRVRTARRLRRLALVGLTQREGSPRAGTAELERMCIGIHGGGDPSATAHSASQAAAPRTPVPMAACLEDRLCLAAHALSQMLCGGPDSGRCRASVRRAHATWGGVGCHLKVSCSAARCGLSSTAHRPVPRAGAAPRRGRISMAEHACGQRATGRGWCGRV